MKFLLFSLFGGQFSISAFLDPDYRLSLHISQLSLWCGSVSCFWLWYRSRSGIVFQCGSGSGFPKIMQINADLGPPTLVWEVQITKIREFLLNLFRILQNPRFEQTASRYPGSSFVWPDSDGNPDVCGHAGSAAPHSGQRSPSSCSSSAGPPAASGEPFGRLSRRLEAAPHLGPLQELIIFGHFITAMFGLVHPQICNHKTIWKTTKDR
jgi:hypothetical protein